MRFSQQVRYAVSGLFDLAYNAGNRSVQVRVIGERQAIPPRYLEQIFQRLRKANLVAAKRGPGGGYRLARPSRDITLRDVVEAVEGGLSSVEPAQGMGPGAAGPDFVWGEIAERFSGVLGEITLEELCRRAAREGVPRAHQEAYTYQI
jgi:Rrf2 family protein